MANTTDAMVRIVNGAEFVMIENLQAFQDGLKSRSVALARFDELWAAMVGYQGLTHPSLVSHSAKSIAERNHGGVYDYFRRYRDPIASAPAGAADVVTDLLPAGVTDILPATVASNLIWWVGGIGLFALWWFRR